MNLSPPLDLSVAIERLLSGASQLVCVDDARPVDLSAAPGRVLADDQIAVFDVPPADNSAMDGYAVRVADAGRSVPVTQRITAGSIASPLAALTAARIFTGGEIPPGAQAVVPQEEVSEDGEQVLLPEPISLRQHIRPRGQDCRRGDLLLPAGRRLRPQDMGLLASQGIARVSVLPPLRVALLSTGDELREPGSGPLPPGAIYNSNRPMLAALLAGQGCEVMDLGIVKDSLAATLEALRVASETADVILSCGGVSVGEADFVRDAVSQLGEISLWRIAIKPGKPFAHGRVGRAHFLGLPGNPASAFVTFVLLARPLLHVLQGRGEPAVAHFPGRADFTVERPGSRDEYLRVSTRIENDQLWATPYHNQSSGILTSITASDALARVPMGQTMRHGDPVQILPLDLMLD